MRELSGRLCGSQAGWGEYLLFLVDLSAALLGLSLLDLLVNLVGAELVGVQRLGRLRLKGALLNFFLYILKLDLHHSFLLLFDPLLAALCDVLVGPAKRIVVKC